MSEFRFEPSSLFLHMAEPVTDASVSRFDHERDALMAVGSGLARYLHERIHWIQHFSSFSGIAQILINEYQRNTVEGMLWRSRDALTEGSFPLREFLEGHDHQQTWDDLELFAAALSGERGIGHYRHDYFGIDWADGVKSGCSLFSRISFGAAAYNFAWPPNQLVSALKGIQLDKVDVVMDDYRRLLGSTSLLELQAELGELHKLGSFMEQSTGEPFGFEQLMKPRPAWIRDTFYQLSQLERSSWHSDLICAEILYCACNMQARLFLPHIGNADTFSEISAFYQFGGMAARVRKVAPALDAIDTDDPHEFFRQARPAMQEVFGCDMLSMIFGSLERWSAMESYVAAEFEPGEPLNLDSETRLAYIASITRKMAAVAREEPLFVVHPGLLYAYDRKRFGDLYKQISHVVEYREESGFTPAPHFVGQGSLAEYMRQVASGVRGQLTRTMTFGTFDDVLFDVEQLAHINIILRPYHLLAVKAGIERLGLPSGLEECLLARVGPIGFAPVPESCEHGETEANAGPQAVELPPARPFNRAPDDLTDGYSDDAVRLVLVVRGRLADGEPFWCYVALKPSKRWDFAAAQIEERLDLEEFEEFGEVIVSGLGVDPPDEVTRKVSELYGADLAAGLATSTFI